jgi:hypothetical protein
LKPAQNVSVPRRALWLALALAFLSLGTAAAIEPAPHAAHHGYVIQPETFWVNLYINNRRVGFGRGRYTRDGARNTYQNDIVFRYNNNSHADRAVWIFDDQLRPLSFKTTTVDQRPGSEPLVVKVDGAFDYKRGNVHVEYEDPTNPNQNPIDVKLPARQVSRFTPNVALAHAALAAGKRYRFYVFSSSLKRFAAVTFTVGDWDGARQAWNLTTQSEEQPDSPTQSLFQTASHEHPNGWFLQTSQPGFGGVTIMTRPTTRDEAIQGFEAEAAALKI